LQAAENPFDIFVLFFRDALSECQVGYIVQPRWFGMGLIPCVHPFDNQIQFFAEILLLEIVPILCVVVLIQEGLDETEFVDGFLLLL